MICIIDYGLGNIGSLINMCKHIGLEAVVSSEREQVMAASHLILPGVGTFDTGMKNLEERGIKQLLDEAVLEQKKNILGICLGAQLMLDSSEEGEKKGLGWVSGKVTRFDASLDIKVPHMGWNNLSQIHDPALFENMPDTPARFYFVHAYHFNLDNQSEVSAETVYGKQFASAFRKGNIFGAQFHPEKSHKFGMQLLKNFASI